MELLPLRDNSHITADVLYTYCDWKWQWLSSEDFNVKFQFVGTLALRGALAPLLSCILTSPTLPLTEIIGFVCESRYKDADICMRNRLRKSVPIFWQRASACLDLWPARSRLADQWASRRVWLMPDHATIGLNKWIIHDNLSSETQSLPQLCCQ